MSKQGWRKPIHGTHEAEVHWFYKGNMAGESQSCFATRVAGASGKRPIVMQGFRAMQSDPAWKTGEHSLAKADG